MEHPTHCNSCRESFLAHQVIIEPQTFIGEMPQGDMRLPIGAYVEKCPYCRSSDLLRSQTHLDQMGAPVIDFGSGTRMVRLARS